MLLKEIGINEKEEKILKSRDFISVEALIRREPLHYYDFTNPLPLDRTHPAVAQKLAEKREFCIIGTMTYIVRNFKNRRSLIKMKITEDITGKILYVNIMGQNSFYDTYKAYKDKKVIIGGIIEYSQDYNSYSVMNPFLVSDKIQESMRIHTVYGTIKDIKDEYFRTILKNGIENAGALDFIPDSLLRRYSLPSFKESSDMMHNPKTMKDVETAKKRAVFEDLLYMATKMELQRKKETKHGGIRMEDDSAVKKHIKDLPFPLTKDQKEAIDNLIGKMKAGENINALVQGDVGTGKTEVAICLLLQAATNGYQASLMVPYTSLAEQHYLDIGAIAEEFGIKTVLLTSDSAAAEKKQIIKEIETGEAQIIIGTHSIFASSIKYKKLGLIIADEEHKFGVMHREKLKDKAMLAFHQVTMSATPIPRSLACTIYGEGVEIISIITKPAERIPIQTAMCQNDITVMNFILKEVQTGHQAYVVCPSIEKGKVTSSVEEKEPIYKKYFEEKGIKVGVITGKVKAKEKQEIMAAFRKNDIQILMATTVIEVGINVPNATCIAITGADRFGFSTLHQLRGRVGRGKYKSYCILQTNSPNEKLDFMCKETDGFKIAMKDLELRGPGSLFGEKQSGNDYYVKLMLAYPNMYKKTKEIATEICKDHTGYDMVERYEKLFIETL